MMEWAMIRCELSLGRRIEVIPALIVFLGDGDIVRDVILNSIINIYELRIIPIQIMEATIGHKGLRWINAMGKLLK